VHIEYFASQEEVFNEKKALADYLKPGGTLIICGDNVRVRSAETLFKGTVVTFGFEEIDTLQASHQTVLYENNHAVGTTFRINVAGNSTPVTLYGALGTPRTYSALAALGVAQTLGLDTIKSAQALSHWTPAPGRLRLIPGMHDSTIIDDTYNASPSATTAGIDALTDIFATRRIAVIGDMLELGKHSADAHTDIGKYVVEHKIDMLITVGFRARTIAEAARDAGMSEDAIRSYEHGESERAGLELAPQIQAGDVIYVKGSQSMRMERTVAVLMSEPARAEELLVRQDEEWKKR
jgi:UDP-N-acetylmuramoyl-tripeptide--D-alanyl-D-alanine ligase